jgi:hypothetical protein
VNEVLDELEPPAWLWPAKPSRPACSAPLRPETGLSPYGKRAIDNACDAIVKAPRGEQERVLNAEAFSIGTLAGASAIPPDLVLRTLLRATSQMRDHDPAWPWRPEEIDLKVRRAFRAGMQRPREARRALDR